MKSVSKHLHHDHIDLLLFFLLSYCITWTLGLIAIIIGLPIMIAEVFAIPGPFVSAILVITYRDGKQGVQRLFKKAFDYHSNPLWYFLASLVPVSIILVSTFYATNFRSAEIPNPWFVPVFDLSFIFFFLIYNGIGEELGWRGFAQPRLQKMMGSLGGSIILGVIWALWHLPLFFIPGSFQYGDPIPAYILLLTSWSIIIAALFNKTKNSIIVAIIFHETMNFIAFTIILPTADRIIFEVAFALIAIFFLPKPLFHFSKNQNSENILKDQ